ncbi:MAG: hypothetical protein N838_16435 [Thiohalocapsa sp. PB-PSB1]|nr:MAG: hypothetical protein N838_16435 [Thiohalocapsa sp. PB-PSB1]
MKPPQHSNHFVPAASKQGRDWRQPSLFAQPLFVQPMADLDHQLP